jgi:hypothetical protein
VRDGPRTIDLALSSPTAVSLGTPSTAVVTIKDDDTAGKVQFNAAVYSLAEGGGAATVTVTRTSGTSSEATVHYATIDADPGSTATPGADYVATSGWLTFGLNERSKTLSVPVIDDGLPNTGAVSVLLALDSPGGGLALGAPSTATLWIVKE